MRPKKILMGTTHEPNDTTSLLRAWGPFTLLEKEGICDLVRKPKTDRVDWFKDWTYWFGVDILYLHRPSDITFTMLAETAKLHGIPVWVDHDDDLMAITPDNPVYYFYKNSNKWEHIERSYEYADILTCSGKLMFRDFLDNYHRKTDSTFLITTSIDDRLLRLKQPFKMNKKISWRGSKSHLIDLLFFDRSIEDLILKREDYEWFFFGIFPHWVAFYELKNRVKYLDQLNLFDFIKAMTLTNSSFHMVPLIDTKFNRVKSDLAWLDATLAGSVVLGPDFEEWQNPGIVHYKSNDAKDFSLQLMTLMDQSEATLKNMHEMSWQFIRDNLTHSIQNKKRREIIKNL